MVEITVCKVGIRVTPMVYFSSTTKDYGGAPALSTECSGVILRFFRAFSSVVRQMPEYNSQRRGTARTLPKLIVSFCVLFVCKCAVAYPGFFFVGGGSTNSVEDRGQNGDLGCGSPPSQGIWRHL